MTAVIAHRGASVAHPANTVAAFRAGVEAGADWIEFDVRRTADDVLVVHHDARLPDGRVLVELTVDELPRWVPTMAEALEACEGASVNIEIKNDPSDPDYDERSMISVAVAGVAVAYRPHHQLLVSSFNVDAVDRIKALDPAIPTGIIVGADLFAPGLWVERATARGHGALHPYVAVVDGRFVELAHDAGLVVNVWTVNDPDEMRRLADLGVDGIFTDLPDLAREVLGSGGQVGQHG